MRFLAVLLLALAVSSPAALAHEPHTSEPIPVAVRTPAASAPTGAGYGFYHSRFAVPRQTVTIGDTVQDTLPWATIAAAYGRWNTAAGWELFRWVGRSPAQVRLAPDLPEATTVAWAWVERDLYPNGFVLACTVHYKPSVGPSMAVDGLAHEIGHCLGFTDHLNYLGDTDGAGPRPAPDATHPQCVSPSAPHYSAYTGIMSYCSWMVPSLHWGVHDRATLRFHGYRNPACRVDINVNGCQ